MSDVIISSFSKSALKLSNMDMKVFKENAEMTANALKVLNLITVHRKDARIKLDGDSDFTCSLSSLFRIPNDFAWSK